MMNDTLEMRSLRWHVMQRQLSSRIETGSHPLGSYVLVRRRVQPDWRYESVAGCWLNRVRQGVGGQSPHR
jgi:hypothetical protein